MKAWASISGRLDSARRAGRIVVRGQPKEVTGFIVLTLLISLPPVLQSVLAKLVVDRVATRSEISVTLVLGAVYALFLLVPDAMQPVAQALSARMESRAVGAIDRELMQAAERISDLAPIERVTFQDRLRTVKQCSLQIPRLFPAVQSGTSTVLTLAGLMFLLGQLTVVLPLLLVLTSIPQVLVERRMNELRYEVMSRRSRPARMLDYCTQVVTTVASAKELRTFGAGDLFLDRARESSTLAIRELQRLRLQQLAMSVGAALLYAITIAGGLWYVATQAADGGLTVGDVAMYVTIVMLVQGKIASLPFSFAVVHDVLTHLNGLVQFIDEAGPTIVTATREQARPVGSLPADGIVFEGVTFQYEGSGRPVVSEFSGTLKAGTVTAVLGANGAGKSTLVKLLTRMFDPDGGSLLLDGHPVSEYDLAEYRRRIATAYQDFAKFSLTLRQNIELNDGSAAATRDARLRESLIASGIDDADLRVDIDAQLTTRFPGGVELSGGEWQMVALARGFFRDAAVLILDEPTAALDPEAEARLYARIRSIIAGRTALIISHRLSAAQLADNIWLIQDGRIVEEGGHADLMTLGGQYAELYQMQVEHYA